MNTVHRTGQVPDIPKMRIILMAMAAGIIIFGGIVCVISPLGEPDEGLQLILPLAVIGLAVFDGIAFFVFAHIGTRAIQKKYAEEPTPPEDLVKAYWPQYGVISLIRAAMIEGIALFALVTIMVTGVWWLLVVPVLGLLAFATLMPSEEKVRMTLERIVETPVN